MIRNSNGKIVDENGVEVFKSEAFKGLSSVDNLVQVCPSTTFLDKQTNAAYVAFPDETRKFVEFHSSKLLDDNFSLASEETKHNEYINNVVCFLALVNKLSSLETEKVRNDILGGTFPTKNDNSNNSMVPMYLCTEMLKAKCLKDNGTPINSLDNYDVTGKTDIPKNSTLGQEFDKVIEKLKQLDYDKSYFNADMSEDSMRYLSACQIDPSGMVDIFAECQDDKCVLYVTQGENSNSIPMFTVQKKVETTTNVENQVSTPEIAAPSVTPNIEIPAIEAPVVPSISNENNSVNNNQPEQNVSASNQNKEDEYKKKLEIIYKKREELENLRKQVTEAEKALSVAESDAYEELASMFKGHVSQNVDPSVSINAAMFK